MTQSKSLLHTVEIREKKTSTVEKSNKSAFDKVSVKPTETPKYQGARPTANLISLGNVRQIFALAPITGQHNCLHPLLGRRRKSLIVHE